MRTPGVVIEPQPDGSLSIQPAEGIHDLRSINGALVWVPVVPEPEEAP